MEPPWTDSVGWPWSPVCCSSVFVGCVLLWYFFLKTVIKTHLRFILKKWDLAVSWQQGLNTLLVDLFLLFSQLIDYMHPVLLSLLLFFFICPCLTCVKNIVLKMKNVKWKINIKTSIPESKVMAVNVCLILSGPTVMNKKIKKSFYKLNKTQKKDPFSGFLYHSETFLRSDLKQQ